LAAPGDTTLDFELIDYENGLSELSLVVWGNTEASVSPDHHIFISINGHEVLDEFWDGKGRHILKAVVMPDVLQEGENRITIQAPGDTGVVADIVYIDSIELVYSRTLSAINDRLELFSNGEEQILLGFDKVMHLFNISNPENPIQIDKDTAISTDNGDTVQFQGVYGDKYLVLGENGAIKPDQIISVMVDSEIRNSIDGAEYIAVGPQPLLAELKPLLDYREAQGLSVLSIPPDVIYDQFGYGFPDPVAIGDFVRYASENWQPAPRYLLIVGDATYDPKGYIAPVDANQMPIFLVPSVFGGETASDVPLGQVNDDPWPDIAIGWIPARNTEHIRTLVEKIIKYEEINENNMNASSNPGKVLAVADGQESYFRSDAQIFLDRFPDQYETALYAPEAGTRDANIQIKDLFAQNNLLVAYFGHGSVNMWGKDRLFSTEDVFSLSAGTRLPIVLNMTCLTGLFTHPEVESLAEALLWQPGGGAVAVLAPTSLTLPGDQSFLSRALVESLVTNPEATLGEIHLQARQSVPLEGLGTIDVMRTFLLFGDPAMSVPDL
jgi:hypothetical protein